MDKDEMGLHAAGPREVLGAKPNDSPATGASFTPGPWATHQMTTKDEFWWKPIVVYRGSASWYPEDDLGEDRDVAYLPENEAANARLIAAAPDLYEALLFVGRVLRESNNVAFDIEAWWNESARVALARVAGES